MQKSGILEAFHISPGDDLQSYENRKKAAALLGFLIECFEKNNFDEENLKRWETLGKSNLVQLKP